jgi:hypothetical protein
MVLDIIIVTCNLYSYTLFKHLDQHLCQKFKNTCDNQELTEMVFEMTLTEVGSD